MVVITFSPLSEKVNKNMALIHRQVKKSTLGKIVNNYPAYFVGSMLNFPEIM